MSFIRRNTWKILLLIFLAVFFMKLYFVLQQPYLGAQAHFEERQINSVIETGLPISWDGLSYSGREYISSPVYYYVMAFFSTFLGVGLALKVIPALFMALLSVVVFMIVKKISAHDLAALGGALLVGFVPILSSVPVTMSGFYSFVFLSIFLTLYFFINIRNRYYLKLFVASVVVLPFVHPLAVIMLFGFLIYYLLMKLDGLFIKKVEVEAILFSIFFMVLALFLRYKQALLVNGLGIVWQNLPIQILDQYFVGVDVVSYVVAVGLVPVVLGMYAIYQYTFKRIKPSVHVFIGLAIAVFLSLWLKIVRPELGLALMSIVLVVLAGEAIRLLIKFFHETKFSSFQGLFWGVLVVVFIFTSVNDSIAVESGRVSVVNEDILDSLEWIRENTAVNSVVLSELEMGHLITNVAERKNVMDDNFVLIKDPDRILRDVDTVFSSVSVVQITKVLNRYAVDYVLVKVGEQNTVFDESNCFDAVYSRGSYTVYQALCRVEEVG